MSKVKNSEYEPEYDIPVDAEMHERWDESDRDYDPFCYGTEWVDVDSIPYFNVKQ